MDLNRQGWQIDEIGVLIDIKDKSFRVRTEKWHMGMRCPFCKMGADYNNLDFIIENMKTKEKLSISGLAPHLIAQHHFFEGNTPYRIDPEKLIRVLYGYKQK